MEKGQKNRDSIVRGIALVLLSVFAFQVVSKSFYTHSHIKDNGNVISHAHPFDKEVNAAPYEFHSHSDSQFIFFNILEIVFYLVLALIAISGVSSLAEFPIRGFSRIDSRINYPA